MPCLYDGYMLRRTVRVGPGAGTAASRAPAARCIRSGRRWGVWLPWGHEMACPYRPVYLGLVQYAARPPDATEAQHGRAVWA